MLKFLELTYDYHNGITNLFTSFKSYYWRIFSGVIGGDAELCVWDVRAVVCHPFQKTFFCALLLKRRLNEAETQILEQQFPFYNKLVPKQQRTFRHRVKSLMLDKQFTGRQGIEVTTEMRVLIAATAAMLTFGFRNFYIGLPERIVIYPEVFFSKANQA